MKQLILILILIIIKLDFYVLIKKRIVISLSNNKNNYNYKLEQLSIIYKYIIKSYYFYIYYLIFLLINSMWLFRTLNIIKCNKLGHFLIDLLF